MCLSHVLYATQVEIGNKGNDDELIQLEMIRAAEGSVPSMLTMADVNYFGARGMPRNQPEALRYYNMAAAAQNTHGIMLIYIYAYVYMLMNNYMYIYFVNTLYISYIIKYICTMHIYN